MRRRYGLIALLALLGGAAIPGACSLLRAEAETRLCRAVLPAVEPDGTIAVAATDVSPGATTVVRIAYAVDVPGRDRRQGTLRCAVKGSLYAELAGRPELAGVEENGRRMGDARLFFLKRYWLGDPAAVAEGEARLTNAAPPGG